MTLDDLAEVYESAVAKRYMEWVNAPEGSGHITNDILRRAGVTAIIRALRDEFREEYGMWERFTKILGSDAAPAPQANTVELSQAFVSQIEQSRTEAHRNTAPAVCEWTWERPSFASYYGWYRTSHGERTRAYSSLGKCIACGLPIKFTEAK